MVIFRKWLWILFALILCRETASAAGSTREQRAYIAAVGAFQDGMWSRAEMELAQFIQKYPKSTNAPQAVLFQAQAEFKQGELTNAIELLTDTNNLAMAGTLADEYFYWTGEFQFQGTNYLGAAETWLALAQKFPGSRLQLQAVVEAAAALTELEDWPQTVAVLAETNGVFQRAARLDAENEQVERGGLLLAQAKFALKDFAGASVILEPLMGLQALKPELRWNCAQLLYQVKLGAGEPDAALMATTNLFQIAMGENNDGWRAESLSLRAAVLEKLNRTDEALVTYRQNLTNTAPAEKQQQAVLKIAELSIAQQQFLGAETNLENFLDQFPDSAEADIALLTLGELQLKDYAAQSSLTNQLTEAQTNFDQFLDTFTNSPLAGRAYLDRGWCDWLAAINLENGGDVKTGAQKYAECFDDFSAAAQTANPPPEDLVVAHFKMGDAQFAQNDFAGALTNYDFVLNGQTNFPAVAQAIGDHALYQSLRAEMELKDWSGARNTLAQILKNYPAGNLADSGTLLLGERLADSQQPSVARALFQKSAGQFTNSPLLPQIKLAVARTYEQEQNWAAAITSYTGWLHDFPTNELAPQADYALAWANFQAANPTNAFNLFTNFVAQFPTNTTLAPLAQWWVADSFYNAGDFVNAEKNYKFIFQNTNWLGSPLENRTNLFYPAQLMAGRAAAARQGYLEAVRDYFSKLEQDTNCLMDLRAQATFEHGKALMLSGSADTNNPLANFALATNEFIQIVQLYPTNEQGALAWLYIGDCDGQLGNYDAATNAYAQVFNSTSADASVRSQAQIAFGLALEKMAALTTGASQNALLKLARNNYYDVFKGNNLRADSGEEADPFWQRKAGLEAERLAEYFQEWPTAVDYYRDMTANWPSLQPTLENKIQTLIKEHPEAAQN
jgi:TolA-binding protein